nr:cobyric acid synthase [Butyrivibrio sp. WCE2006]
MDKSKAISTDKLNIGYKEDLIRDISIIVKKGKIVTLIGPNGCGKTTLLKTLTGELSLRGGTVYLNGEDKSALSASEIAKRMSLLMTYRVKPELMTCREVVEIGRYPYTGRLGILSEADREKVEEAMRWTDVSELSDKFFEKISDGQKQRVLLARAICQEPEILVLDEPTSFLDIRHKIDILQKIKAYVQEKNVAVLMSLHELEIARKISDIVVAIGERKVLKIGKPSEVFKESFIRKLYHIENIDIELLGEMPWEKEKESTQANAPESSLHNNEESSVVIGKPVEESSKEASFNKNKIDASDEAPFLKRKKAKVIMIQGTMSNAGKSVIAAGLCRIFSDDGYKVAPFKSQNMALNSFITKDGLEMGRAQVMQAECARIEPMSIMNPILLKPTSDVGSQVIVNGRVIGNMKAMEYFRHKKDYVKDILDAYNRLSDMVDVIVVEGAGSPVEMNLKKDDIVNMGLAEMIDAPVLLVGDIDRGGVFPQLLGTLDLLEDDERRRVKGLIVNKFRGDIRLFDDGIRILEDKGKTRVAGVVPYIDVKLDDEDSLSDRFTKKEVKTFDIAVIRLPHISNFTDFDTFEQLEDVSVRYVYEPSELKDPDLIILPGTKNTIADLRSIKENGLFDEVIKKAAEGICVFGICGGFQMLGRKIEDPYHVEEGGSIEGLELLPVDTVLENEKVRTRYEGKVNSVSGILSGLEGILVEGYEIHMGKTVPYDENGKTVPYGEMGNTVTYGEMEKNTPAEEPLEFTSGRTGFCSKNVYGTYIHGFFDKKEIASLVIKKIAKARGKDIVTDKISDYDEFKDREYDRLAKALRESLDMDYIYEVLNGNYRLIKGKEAE